MKNTTVLNCFMLLTILFAACDRDEIGDVDFRSEMRRFVILISETAHSQNPDFIIIPQNGQELITENGGADGIIESQYLEAICGIGREDMFYGYDNDNEPTPETEMQYMLDYCLLYEQNGIEVLTTDYCSDHAYTDASYEINAQHGFISFAAPQRDLNVIPDYPAQPYNHNTDDIIRLSDAKNFLYLINSEFFESKQQFVEIVSATDYDLIIMDLFHEGAAFTATEIDQLKTKAGGGKRLVIAYMSIGEAEDYRYYWDSRWEEGEPEWLQEENPDWEGNYKVRYWEPEWQSIICTSQGSYLKQILNAGFDGVYLDIIDAFEYFEE